MKALVIVLLIAPSFQAKDDWVWLSGSKRHDMPGSYGTRDQPSKSNFPGSRKAHIMHQDPQSGLIFLFGGVGYASIGASYGPLDDVWVYNEVNDEWSWESGSNRIGAGVLYGTLSVPSAVTTPGGRDSAASFFHKNIYVFGGRTYVATENYDGFIYTPEYRSDFWEYQISSAQWRWVGGYKDPNRLGLYGTKNLPQADVTPGARANAACAFDDKSLTFYLFGGIGYAEASTSAGYLSDIWAFDVKASLWRWAGGSKSINTVGIYGTRKQAAEANVPGGRIDAAAFVASDGVFRLYGGYGYSSSGIGFLGDMWQYDSKLGQFSWLLGANTPDSLPSYGTINAASPGNQPGGRSSSAVAFDHVDRVLYLFGGYAGTDVRDHQLYNDMWTWDLNSQWWKYIKGSRGIGEVGVYGTQKVSDSGNSPGARNASAILISTVSPNIFLFGGNGFGVFDVVGQLSDFWKFELDPSRIPASNSSVNQQVLISVYVLASVLFLALCVVGALYGPRYYHRYMKKKRKEKRDLEAGKRKRKTKRAEMDSSDEKPDHGKARRDKKLIHRSHEDSDEEPKEDVEEERNARRKKLEEEARKKRAQADSKGANSDEDRAKRDRKSGRDEFRDSKSRVKHRDEYDRPSMSRSKRAKSPEYDDDEYPRSKDRKGQNNARDDESSDEERHKKGKSLARKKYDDRDEHRKNSKRHNSTDEEADITSARRRSRDEKRDKKDKRYNKNDDSDEERDRRRKAKSPRGKPILDSSTDEEIDRRKQKKKYEAASTDEDIDRRKQNKKYEPPTTDEEVLVNRSNKLGRDETDEENEKKTSKGRKHDDTDEDEDRRKPKPNPKGKPNPKFDETDEEPEPSSAKPVKSGRPVSKIQTDELRSNTGPRAKHQTIIDDVDAELPSPKLSKPLEKNSSNEMGEKKSSKELLDRKPPKESVDNKPKERVDPMSRIFKMYKGVLVAGFKRFEPSVDFKPRIMVSKAIRNTWYLFQADVVSEDLAAAAEGNKVFFKQYADNVEKIEKMTKESFEQDAALSWFYQNDDNFVKVIGFCEAPLGLLLKYYQKGTLAQWIEDNESDKSFQAIFQILLGISFALKKMHSLEMAHSDIRPKSVMIDERNNQLVPVLKDFEITQVLSHKVFPGRRFHRTNVNGDYLLYASPETIKRFKSKQVNNGSIQEFIAGDVFSLGMLIYELLTQQTPWSYNPE